MLKWVFTIAWLCLAVSMVVCKVVESGLSPLDYFLLTGLNEIGDFLAGVLAPLAFAWLVFGYWQNQKALLNQSIALNDNVRHQSEMAEEAKLAREANELLLQPEFIVENCKAQEDSSQSVVIKNIGERAKNIAVIVSDGFSQTHETIGSMSTNESRTIDVPLKFRDLKTCTINYTDILNKKKHWSAKLSKSLDPSSLLP